MLQLRVPKVFLKVPKSSQNIPKNYQSVPKSSKSVPRSSKSVPKIFKNVLKSSDPCLFFEGFPYLLRLTLLTPRLVLDCVDLFHCMCIFQTIFHPLTGWAVITGLLSSGVFAMTSNGKYIDSSRFIGPRDTKD